MICVYLRQSVAKSGPALTAGFQVVEKSAADKRRFTRIRTNQSALLSASIRVHLRL